MGLFDIFRQRQSDNRGAATPSSTAAIEPVEAARTRARRRLIGAVVLLGLGIIAFPILFETQPRPIPVDIPIRIPSRDEAPAFALPKPRPPVTASASSVVASEAPRDPAPAPTIAPANTKAQAPAPVVAVAAPKPDTAPAPPKAQPASAPPKAQPTPAPAPATVAVAVATPKAEAGGRFVVQVGAFAESSTVRDARAKVEKLGLSTYTQVVETASGARTRVRLGPFATREEADKVASRVKAAGLPASVLTP